jgi:hypothetical protein
MKLGIMHLSKKKVFREIDLNHGASFVQHDKKK